MSRDADVLAEWSRRHDGYDQGRSALTRSWVLAMHRLASPVAAAGVPASVVSAAGVGTAYAATRTSRRMAAVLVLATAVCDGLDGAVATHRRTASRLGTAVDHGCDRATDLLFALALRRAGASRRLAMAAAASPVAMEMVRGALRRSSVGAPAVATVGERPARVAVVVCGLLGSPSVGAAVVATLSVAGVAQLVAARRGRQ